MSEDKGSPGEEFHHPPWHQVEEGGGTGDPEDSGAAINA